MKLFSVLTVLFSTAFFAKGYVWNTTVTSTCTEYSADNTNYATVGYCTCSISVCPGDVITISGCANCNNDNQYIRLYSSGGFQQLTYADGTGSSCSPCAEIINYRPAVSYCQDLTLQEGCVGDDSCNGEFVVSVTSPYNPFGPFYGDADTDVPALRTNKENFVANKDYFGILNSLSQSVWMKFRGVTHRSQLETRISTESSSNTPQCTYVYDWGALAKILGIGLTIAIVVSSVCGCLCCAGLIFLCVMPCVAASQTQQKQQQSQAEMAVRQGANVNAIHQPPVGQPMVLSQGQAVMAPPGLVYYGQQPDGTPIYVMANPSAASTSMPVLAAVPANSASDIVKDDSPAVSAVPADSTTDMGKDI